MEITFLPLILLGAAVLLLAIFFYYVPFLLWISAKVSGVNISLIQLFLMRIRKVPPYIITRAMIEAHKAGIKTLTRDELEAHYLAGGHVEKVVHALVSASKANIDLPFQMATAIDLAGRDVFEAVQMSVNPKVIDTITYVELRELAYMGATVLHEEAIFPVRQEGIPINIRNTNRPQDPGTLIVESTCRKPRYTITGIAGTDGFAAITIEKAMMNSEIGFCRKVLQVFEDNGVSIEHMPSGIDTMTIFVHKDAFEEKEQKILAGIHKAVNPDHIELESDLALIAIVGRGMKSTRGTAGRIFSALAHAHINVKMIDQGSSELNIIVGVRHDEFKHAIRALYDIFVLTQI